jgi:autotransporter-associated beta strand protein
LVLALAGGVWLAGAGQAGAQTVDTWNGGTSNNFTDGTNWSGGAPANQTTPVGGSIATFSGGAGFNPSLNTGYSLYGLNMAGPTSWNLSGTGSLTLGSGGITMGGSGQTIGLTGGINLGSSVLLVTSGSNSVTSPISDAGNGAVHVQTGALLLLTGTNTYSGNTIIDTSATLELGGTTGTLGTTSAVTDNGTLLLNRSNSLTVGNLIAGTGAVTQMGAGTVTLTGANTYSGGTTISAGIVSVGIIADGASSNVGTGDVTLDGGTLLYTGAAASTSRQITFTANGGEIDSSGSGALDLTNTALGFVAASGPTITLGGTNTGQNIFAGIIGSNMGAVTLDKSGAGTWVLASNNGYTGVTNITGGTLQIGAGGTTGSLGTGAVTDDANLVFDLSSTTTVSNVINGTGTVQQTGTGTTILTANNGYSGGTIISAGTLQIGSGGATGSLGSGGVADNANLVFDLSSTVTVGNTITGSGTLQVTGSGDIALTGTDTYTGVTTISSGTLQIGIGGTAGTINNTSGIVNNGVLDFVHSDTLTIAAPISGSGTVQQISTGTTVLAGANTYTGATTVAAGILQLGSADALGSAGSHTSSVSVFAGAALDLNGFSPTAGGNNVPLSMSGSFSGTVGALTNSSATAATFGGHVTLAAASSIGGVGDITLTGPITGAFGLTKVGNDNLIITGTNGTTTTTISAGTLQIGNGGASGALGSAAVTDNANLVFDLSSTLTVANTITGSGTLQQIGTGTTILTGPDTYTGVTTVSAGTLQVGNGGTGASINGTSSVVDNSALVFDQSDTTTLAAAISGTGSVTENGAGGTGVLNLTGASSYTGVTTITNGGTIVVTTLANGGSNSNIGASTNAAANLVLDGGTLQYTGAAVSSDRLFTLTANGGTLDASGSGALTLTNTGAVGFSGSGARTLTLQGTNTGNNSLAALIGDGTGGSTSLVKQGTGTWVLANTANTYTGSTTITGGTLTVTSLADGGSASSIGASTNAAANLVLNGGTLQFHEAGTPASTDRLFTLGTGASAGTIAVTGTGPSSQPGELEFTNTGNIAFLGSGTRTLTLAGSGGGFFAPVLGDNGGATSLVVNNTSLGWVLVGNNTYTGSTTITSGTLVLGIGGTTGSIADTSGVTDNGLLLFNRSDTVTFAPVITGSGQVTQLGSGTTILTSANTYTGATTVTAGTLNIAPTGSITSNTTVQSAGALVVNGTITGTLTSSGWVQGTGTVTGATAINAGSINPGNSIGTIHTGTYTQAAGATYNLQYTISPAANDQISVTGTATLASDSIINLSQLDTAWTPDGTVLHAITTTAGATDNGAIINPSFNSIFLSYAGAVDGNNYDVEVTRHPYASLSQPGNRTSVASALDGDAALGVAAGTPRYALLTRLDSLSLSDYQTALDALSPEFYGAVAEATIQTARVFHSNVNDYLDQHRFSSFAGGINTAAGNPAASLASASADPNTLYYAAAAADTAPAAGQDQNWDIFLIPVGQFAERTAEYDRLGYNSDSFGMLGGAAVKLDSTWTVGVAADYLRTRVDFVDYRGNADVDSARVGPFVGTTWGNLYADGSASFGYHWLDTSRSVTIPNPSNSSPNPSVGNPMAGNSDNNFNAYDLSADVTVGYRLPLNDWCNLTPLAAVDYTYFSRDGLTETNGPTGTNLAIQSQDFGDLRSSLGAKFDCQFQVGTAKIVPAVSLAWTHEYLDDNRVTASFVGGSTPFVVESGLGKTDGAAWSMGVTAAMTSRLSLYLRYDGQWVPHDQSHSFSAGLTLGF